MELGLRGKCAVLTGVSKGIVGAAYRGIGRQQEAGLVYLERLQDYFTREPHGHVGMIVVIEEGEGSGVGGALMREAEVWAREQGYRKLTLTVFEAEPHGARRLRAPWLCAETLRYVKIL